MPNVNLLRYIILLFGQSKCEGISSHRLIKKIFRVVKITLVCIEK